MGGKLDFKGNEEVPRPEMVLRKLCDEYAVVEVAYDPWQMHDMAQRLSRERVAWFNDFSQVVIDPRVKGEMVEYMLGITEQDKLDDSVATQKTNKKIILMDAVATETKALGDNRWGLFNGATYYTTHLIDQKHETFGNLFGTKAQLNDKAFKFCEKKLLEV